MNAIKKYRLISGFTQAELAEKLEINQSAVALWETGKCAPRSNKLKKIAQVLNCTVMDLLQTTE